MTDGVDIFGIDTVGDIDEITSNLKATDNEYNRYQFAECIDRNVMLIGRTRTGKSTIANIIENIFYVSTQQELYSQTKKAEYHKVLSASGTTQYYFNIIDTPGLFDISVAEQDKLTNDHIALIISDCLKHDVTNIHLFAFTFNLIGGINEKDIKSMIFVKEKYPQLRNYMALIITNCEHLTANEKTKLVNDFFCHPEVSSHNFVEFFSQATLLHLKSPEYPEVLLKRVDTFLNAKHHQSAVDTISFKESVTCYARYKEYLKELPYINFKLMKYNDSTLYNYETNLENNTKTNDSCISFKFQSFKNEYHIDLIAAILSYKHNNNSQDGAITIRISLCCLRQFVSVYLSRISYSSPTIYLTENLSVRHFVSAI
ncbi:unnamed protein product [Didymodactylos carnosus]|uniref:AIG1-type G domain-containing protein n=1 Tax=Didymodactylos carnosus TaxID=1234261 RepID=A0A815I9I8_9BILA|nr:unnamed protein product [Didymodactylos carnosus]CAF4243078.1 unnamed protein product [Didymodactylos carnosus]